jgi:putative transposase
MRFVDPRKTPFVKPKDRGDLPHLHKPGGFYFVTYRLLDAVVAGRRSELPEAGYDDADPSVLIREYEPPLTLGSCVLRRPDVAKVVQDAFLHFEGQRYNLLTWCVMPNHVHVIFSSAAGFTPSSILQSWKGFTAREINRLLGTTGPRWERESFDHLIRTEASLEKFVKYVNQNPVVAGLCSTSQEWPYGAAGVGFRHA